MSYTLLFLGNRIGESGLNELYTAMKYQVDLAHEMNRTVANGLMRLSLQVSGALQSAPHLGFSLKA